MIATNRGFSDALAGRGNDLNDAIGEFVPLPGTALVTSQYVDARAHGEGTNGNQALFRVYDRMTNQVTG